jgi:hypothetical protein
MDDRELKELRDQKNWDHRRARQQPAVKNARAIVSVPFARADFEKVAESAEQLGKRTSEFIREAALERALSQKQLGVLASYSNTSGAVLFTPNPPQTTWLSGTGSQLAETAVTG